MTCQRILTTHEPIFLVNDPLPVNYDRWSRAIILANRLSMRCYPVQIEPSLPPNRAVLNRSTHGQPPCRMWSHRHRIDFPIAGL